YATPTAQQRQSAILCAERVWSRSSPQSLFRCRATKISRHSLSWTRDVVIFEIKPQMTSAIFRLLPQAWFLRLGFYSGDRNSGRRYRADWRTEKIVRAEEWVHRNGTSKPRCFLPPVE